MNLESLKRMLAGDPSAQLMIQIGSEQNVAAHFHLTEVGKISKDFIDCGGVRRSSEKCVLQTYVANDVEHRLAPSKFLGILEKASVLGFGDETEVEIEVQGATIETYSVADVVNENGFLILRANPIQTACLAPDACGLPVSSGQSSGCCSSQSDCC